MNIAYYEENDYHTEILGTFLYYFYIKQINIVVYNDSDKSDYINYYKKNYNFELKKTSDLENDYSKYKYIIIGTSDSITNIKNIFNNINDKIISIYHLKENLININNNSIVLSPLNIVNYNCHYILPIHGFIKENENNYNKKNIFTLIGRFKDNNRDTNDVLLCLNKYLNLDFEFHIYVRHIKFVPKSLLDFSNKNPNRLKIFIKIKTEMLHNKLLNSKFLLTLASKNSCYHKDRLSGIIPLSLNYNIPIIMDNDLHNIYDIKSCITYENSLIEVIEKAINMQNIEYKDLINQVVIDKHNIINRNNIILDNLFRL